ncbi:hypothetical protein B0813_001212 [Candidatus Fervidibacteria bacterium JGI MDM2 SSWTFF-3-K9]
MSETVLAERDAEQLLEKAAQVIVRRGMEVPAILFLEMHKPLANLIGHAVWVTMPVWALFFGVATTNEIGALLSDPERIERLIQRIEELSAKREAEKKRGES